MAQKLALIFTAARKNRYGVAIETINLSEKKTKIQKKWEKEYNRMISRFPYNSRFPYTRYMDNCESSSIRREVPLYYVSPYWEKRRIPKHSTSAVIRLPPMSLPAGPRIKGSITSRPNQRNRKRKKRSKENKFLIVSGIQK